ncbi:hypothetical protein AeMF1_020832 [Aphanomyces euteiches]|nr:hypothetical protein AeMF1_020832 [Aphanomyces euteiches]
MQRATSIQDLRNNRIAANTKASYHSGLNVIVSWIRDHGDANLLTPTGDIDLRVFGYGDFLNFIEWTVRNTNKKPGTLSGYRSALRYYYRNAGIPIPPEFDDDMKGIFQGIRRLFADEDQLLSSRESGKRPLGYTLYSLLCRESLGLLDEDAIGVTFFKSKTDQSGMKRRDPKHVYANPNQPETCVFLALGIYLACNPTITPDFVFPGVN